MKSGRNVRCRPRRAAEVASELQSISRDADLYAALWPQLAVISCWTEAAAAHFVPPLRSLFPQIAIQPKGLLATEGFVSFPWAGANGSALAIRSHFFEFLEPGAAGRVRLADEVEVGGRYTVLLTTAGGLYRYNLGDEVEICGRFADCPVLKFLGRSGATSDLVGEKLSEAHVAAALACVFEAVQLSPSFVLLAPHLDSPPRYVLYLQGTAGDAAAHIATQLDLRLQENPYYRHAREFNQLGPVEVFVLGNDVPAAKRFEHRRIEQGQKAGNIKPAVLDRDPYWGTVFNSPGSVSSADSCTLSGSC